MIIFDLTFKADGGITGQYIIIQFVIFYKRFPPKYDDGWEFNGRVFYDLLYTFVIIIVVNQIISGIIIDTFASLRSEIEQRVKDEKEICFICGNY